MTSAKTDLVSEEDPHPSLRERFADLLTRVQFVVYLTLVIVLLAIGFLWPRMFIVIPPGHRGVMYRTVSGGTVTDRSWPEGLHVIPPWDRLTAYDIRLRQSAINFRVLSDEGLSLGVQVVVRYRPREEMLGHLQQDIGPEYFDRLVRPEIEAHIRRTFGGRPAHEIYASVRDVLQEMGQFSVIERADQTGKGREARPYLYVQEMKLVGIELPKIVEDAILEKYHQEQLMLAYKYKLEREEKEADRKRTEAAGIRDFNLIAGKVSPDMLRWRSIDATLELSKSTNSKVVVLGSGQNGLMMQLNMGDNQPGAPSSVPVPVPAPETPPPQAPAPKRAAPKPGAGPGRPADNKPPAAPPPAPVAPDVTTPNG